MIICYVVAIVVGLVQSGGPLQYLKALFGRGTKKAKNAVDLLEYPFAFSLLNFFSLALYKWGDWSF